MLQLPYKGSAVSMFVFLPPYAAPRGVNNILKRLTPENLHEILTEEAMIPREVEVGLPRFSVEQSLELVPVSLFSLFNAMFWLLYSKIQFFKIFVETFNRMAFECCSS